MTLKNTWKWWPLAVVVEVRRSFGGRRLTVIRTDGTTVRLPVPCPRDQRWNEMLNQAQYWAANARGGERAADPDVDLAGA